MNGLPDLSASQLPAAQAISLPPRCYSDRDVTAQEIETFFRKGWLGIGRVDQVAEPGAYRTLDMAGQAVILTRDWEGNLRAFANSCRHRGARLIDGASTCNGLRCPFHSWFYGLDGALVRAPNMDERPGFNRSDYGLIEYLSLIHI